MTWIDSLLDTTKFAESPKSFFYWSGLATISAVVKNRIWLDKGIYKLYPNIYVLLIAKSGLRKGYPVSLSKQLVYMVNNTKIIAGRSSIQAIIQELSKARKTDAGLVNEACAYINSGEMASSLVRDQDALTILTDLYDGHYNKEWKNVLKSTGTETLKNVNLTLLGALNQPHFEDMMTEKDISGGFIARCIVVLEERRALKNSLLRVTQQVSIEELATHLNELAKLEGPMKIEEEAIQAFESWYDTFEPEAIDDRTGTANRIHDQILKVAMLLSLSRDTSMTIMREDIEEAMQNCLATSSVIRRIISGKGKSELAEKTKLIIEEMVKRDDHTVSRAVLLSKYLGDIEVSDLDKIIEKLIQAEFITAKREGKNWLYKLTQNFLNQYEKFLVRAKTS